MCEVEGSTDESINTAESSEGEKGRIKQFKRLGVSEYGY